MNRKMIFFLNFEPVAASVSFAVNTNIILNEYFEVFNYIFAN